MLWEFISTPWVCAMLALALNSAAYSTLLFHGAVKAIPSESMAVVPSPRDE